MSFDISNLNVLGNSIGSMLPSTNDIVSNIALGGITTVALAGFKSQAGQDAVDPLHLFHQQQAAANPSTPVPAPTNNPNLITGATITQSAFAAMSQADKALMITSGVHVVAG